MNNFTPRAQQVLQLARQEADRFNHGYIGTEHLLLGLIALGQGVAVTVLRRQGLDLDTLRLEVEKAVGVGSDMKTVGNVPYTPRVKKVLALAGTEARAMNVEFVGTEHILLGLLREGEGVAARILTNLHVDIDKIREAVMKELDPNFEPGQPKEEPEEPGPGPELEPGPGGMRGGPKDSKTPALATFGRDLTALAQKGALDPVIGRTDEIERVMRILCRRTKNNPALLGAPAGFTVTVRSAKVSAGAGFVVALTGDIMTMPGLPKVPAAERKQRAATLAQVDAKYRDKASREKALGQDAKALERVLAQLRAAAAKAARARAASPIDPAGAARRAPAAAARTARSCRTRRCRSAPRCARRRDCSPESVRCSPSNSWGTPCTPG